MTSSFLFVVGCLVYWIVSATFASNLVAFGRHLVVVVVVVVVVAIRILWLLVSLLCSLELSCSMIISVASFRHRRHLEYRNYLAEIQDLVETLQ